MAVSVTLRFHVTKSGDEQISWQEYGTCYIAGLSIADVPSFPSLKNLRKEGLEVRYMVDPVECNCSTCPRGLKRWPSS